MSEWWTYAPSDFLLFSARTWYRLVARYNADLWPLQAVALAVGLLLLVLVARGSDPRGRIVGIVLAASWVVVGYAFHHERHTEVNWAASGFAVASFVQAALLAVAAFAGNGLALRRPVRIGDRIALLVAALAIVAYPLVSVATGRGIAAGETFGTLPDPTAIASVALLSLAQARRRWVVLAIPIATCAIASIFLHALRAAEWPLPLAAAVVAVVAARRVR